MEDAEKKHIPPSVRHRLPKYLIHIRRLGREKVQWISSSDIAGALELTSSTVRQDLSHLEFSGISKKGYEINSLENSLLKVLRIGKKISLIIIGAGNLGRAVALHNGFAEYGFTICFIFDNNPQVIGTGIGDHIVRNIDELETLTTDICIDIGILTVPYKVAQAVADKLVAIGVRGILNFTQAHIITKDTTRVMDNRIISNLLELNCIID